MIDGQSDGDGLLADTLLADLTKQAIGTEVEAAATFGDRQDVCTEPVAAVGLAEETGFPPDDVGPKRSLGVIVGQVQAGGREEGPEHRLLRQQGLAGIPGALAGMRLLALLQGDTKVIAGGEQASSNVFGAIAALSPSVFELNDDAGEFDQPEAQCAGFPFAP